MYTVKHCDKNPRNNESIDFDTKKQAVEEMRKYVSDEKFSGCSILIYKGEKIAHRDWNKKNISW